MFLTHTITKKKKLWTEIEIILSTKIYTVFFGGVVDADFVCVLQISFVLNHLFIF